MSYCEEFAQSNFPIHKVTQRASPLAMSVSTFQTLPCFLRSASFHMPAREQVNRPTVHFLSTCSFNNLSIYCTVLFIIYILPCFFALEVSHGGLGVAYSPSISKVRELRWADYVARMEKGRSAFQIWKTILEWILRR